MHDSNVAAAEKSFSRSLQIFRDSGQKSKSVYPLVGLAGVRFESGDLAGAKSLLEEGLQLSREADDKHEAAYALTGLGNVALAEDRVADASHFFDEARKIRTAIGEASAAEQSRVDLARAALAEKNYQQVEAFAGAAAAEFEKQKLADDQAVALSVLARGRTAAGRRGDAEKALAKARALAGKSQYDEVRREVLLASSVLRAARGDAAGAASSLAGAAARATEQGLIAFALEARLMEARILASAAKLARVEKDASARGFRRIAREAKEAKGA